MEKKRRTSSGPAALLEADLKIVFDSIQGAIVVTGAHGRIEFYNPQAARILGCEGQDLMGWSWAEAADFTKDSTGERLDFPVAPGALKTGPFRLPNGAILHNLLGARIAVEGEVSPVISNGEILGGVITLRDVSQRDLDQSEIRQEEKMLALSRFAGGVARDLNDLLQVILGHGSLLSSVISEQGDAVSIRAILDAARMSSEITKQLLSFSRRQARPEQIFEVNDCVAKMGKLVTNRLGKAFQFHLDLDPDAGKVKMNEGQFEQVLLHLTQSARDAMPDGGTIFISTKRAGARPWSAKQHYVRLRLEHSGRSIPEGALEKVFEPFSTVGSSSRGSGLGLAIVYGIVRDAGGKITAESTVGLGTAFEAMIPRFNPAAAPEQTAAAKTILVVDDEFRVRNLLMNYFQLQGFRLIDAANGQEALEAAAAYDGQIDLLISDVLMPLMDGPTLAHRLAEARPGIKTLFISALPGESIEELTKYAVPAGYLQKPFALPELLEKVEALTA